ncbi:LapA family protein [Hymenobacter crusticola]|uniref:LapA family protein n=1 Tax=Hymenobacter crusticola TaxID=1770526 RepID=UPI00117AEA94|nr:LapA family protein [Hymenobacter crusticola]
MNPLDPYVAITEIAVLLLASFGLGYGWAYWQNRRRIRHLQQHIKQVQKDLSAT